MFTPENWGDDPILTSIFFNWVVQPPTRNDDLPVYPIIYKVLYIPGGAGFLSSTVFIDEDSLYMFV